MNQMDCKHQSVSLEMKKLQEIELCQGWEIPVNEEWDNLSPIDDYTESQKAEIFFAMVTWRDSQKQECFLKNSNLVKNVVTLVT